jgi:hypothetical protein
VLNYRSVECWQIAQELIRGFPQFLQLCYPLPIKIFPLSIGNLPKILDESVLISRQIVLVTLLPTHVPITHAMLMPCMFLPSPRAQPFGRPETRADPAVAQQPGHPGAAGAPSSRGRLRFLDEVEAASKEWRDPSRDCFMCSILCNR